MNLSYWEQKSWFSHVDFTIIGSGIVGLNTALYLKKKYPKATIIILEKGSLPQGASTKNAGFACFGSLSEIINDLKSHSEDEVFDLVQKRWEGLQLLISNLGSQTIDYQQNGGYELFEKSNFLWDECISELDRINGLLEPIFNDSVFSECNNKFSFNSIKESYIFNPFEGQIDTGNMMLALLHKVRMLGVKIINNCEVLSFEESGNAVKINCSLTNFTTNKLVIATNGFAHNLISVNVKPARAQVLITKPIKNLHIKGTFHFDQGYYYFRNIDQRILLGGARNINFKTEETTSFGVTENIQNRLDELLRTIILPNTPVEIDRWWSGIMGVGHQKRAIVKELGDHVVCGVRLGGMGVAIGSSIGKEIADLL